MPRTCNNQSHCRYHNLCLQHCKVIATSQWRSQAGAHWGTCPSNWRLCPTSAGAPENFRCRMSIANWALEVRKGVEIELRSLAICIFRITRSICSPKYYSDLTLCARRFVAKALSKCSNSRRRYGLK